LINISDVKIRGINKIEIPKLFKIKQSVFNKRLSGAEIPETINREIGNSSLQNRLNEGNTVAICVGSRGIDKLDIVVKSIVEKTKNLNCNPFIIPAMGSHGGATVEGQEKVLKKYGITEENLGVPIKATMDVVKLGTTLEGTPIYMDRIAYNSDAIIVVNRVKVHTRFSGPYESGILKMLVIIVAIVINKADFIKYLLNI